MIYRYYSTSLIGDDKYKKRSDDRNCVIDIASGFRILFSYILTEVHVYIIHTYIHERYVCILAINIAYNFNILWYILHTISISCGISYSITYIHTYVAERGCTLTLAINIYHIISIILSYIFSK